MSAGNALYYLVGCGSGDPVKGEVLSAGTASTDRRGGVVEAIRAESECVRTE